MYPTVPLHRQPKVESITGESIDSNYSIIEKIHRKV